jgi:hypothetical protein
MLTVQCQKQVRTFTRTSAVISVRCTLSIMMVGMIYVGANSIHNTVYHTITRNPRQFNARCILQPTDIITNPWVRHYQIIKRATQTYPH